MEQVTRKRKRDMSDTSRINDTNTMMDVDLHDDAQQPDQMWPLLDEDEPPEPGQTPEQVEELRRVWSAARSLLAKVESFVEDPHLRGKVPWTIAERSEVYTMLYDICIQPQGSFYETRLYRNYSLYMADYLRNRVRPKSQDKQDMQLLIDVSETWKTFNQTFSRFCASLFSYLDRFHVRTGSLRSLRLEAHYRFKTIVFDELKTRLRAVVLRNIEEDRKGKMINRPLLRDVIAMFRDMGSWQDEDSRNKVYEVELEFYVEQGTISFYKSLSDELIANSSLMEYMKAAEEKIVEEQRLLSAIFDSISQRKIMRLVEEQLLVTKQKELFDMPGSGVNVLLREEKFEDLARLYALYSRIEDGVLPIAAYFRDHIAAMGSELYERHAQNVHTINDFTEMARALIDTYVGDLLSMHERMDNMVRRSFSNNTVFHKALSDGFKMFVNKGFRRRGSRVELRPTQLFAFFCDDLLRRRDERFENTAEKVVKFIQFFNEKDVFIEEYKKQLSKRLMTDKDAADNDDERTVISKLKYYYQGIGDIYKLEKMLTDKAMASELKIAFDAFVQKNQLAIPFDLSVTVLTTGMWPISDPAPMIPPPEFTKAAEIFTRFYDERNSKRVLKWVHSRSRVTMEGRFKGGNKILDVSAYQAAVLLMFNSGGPLTMTQIGEGTDITKEEIKKIIASLTRKRIRILNVSSSSDGSGDTKYVVNEAFTHKSRKITVAMPRVTEEESMKTIEKVDEDRAHVLDAAIVRIMKSRKTLRLQALIQEILEHVHERFRPEIKAIKQRIESLIEREYLERSKDDNQVFMYRA